MQSSARIQASVDEETKRTLEKAAARQKLSLSAYLRQLAVRIREGGRLL